VWINNHEQKKVVISIPKRSANIDKKEVAETSKKELSNYFYQK
jgi:hypothetical protein